MRFQLDVDDLLLLGSYDRDCGGDSDFDRCVYGGQHCVCLGVSKGDDEVGELGGVIFADMGDNVCSVWCGLKRRCCDEVDWGDYGEGCEEGDCHFHALGECLV